jgi:outer membrane murein-binding lipoprotein Lpp
MNGDPGLFEYAVFVIGVIGLFLSWLIAERRRLRELDRGDAAEPLPLRVQLSTLSSKVAQIEKEVEGMGDDLEAKASKEDVEQVARTVRESNAAIARISASLPDIESRQRAQGDALGEMKADLAATRASVSHIDTQLGRIMNALVDKGMER